MVLVAPQPLDFRVALAVAVAGSLLPIPVHPHRLLVKVMPVDRLRHHIPVVLVAVVLVVLVVQEQLKLLEHRAVLVQRVV